MPGDGGLNVKRHDVFPIRAIIPLSKCYANADWHGVESY